MEEELESRRRLGHIDQERIAHLRAHVAALVRTGGAFLAMVDEHATGSFGDALELATKHGVVRKVAYDPATHGEQWADEYGMEPGDNLYLAAHALDAALVPLLWPLGDGVALWVAHHTIQQLATATNPTPVAALDAAAEKTP